MLNNNLFSSNNGFLFNPLNESVYTDAVVSPQTEDSNSEECNPIDLDQLWAEETKSYGLSDSEDIDQLDLNSAVSNEAIQLNQSFDSDTWKNFCALKDSFLFSLLDDSDCQTSNTSTSEELYSSDSIASASSSSTSASSSSREMSSDESTSSATSVSLDDSTEKVGQRVLGKRKKQEDPEERKILNRIHSTQSRKRRADQKNIYNNEFHEFLKFYQNLVEDPSLAKNDSNSQINHVVEIYGRIIKNKNNILNINSTPEECSEILETLKNVDSVSSFIPKRSSNPKPPVDITLLDKKEKKREIDRLQSLDRRNKEYELLTALDKFHRKLSILSEKFCQANNIAESSDLVENINQCFLKIIQKSEMLNK